MFEVVSALLAVVLLVSIAFPQLFAHFKKDPEKTVGSSYWGVYDGTPTHDIKDHKMVAPKPGRKAKVIAGSQMYAGSKRS
jgi:hypothetical protein